MAKKKNSELRFVLPLIGGCLLAILIFVSKYWPEFVTLVRDWLFISVFVLLAVAFLAACYYAVVMRNTVKDNTTRWLTAIVAVIICVWVGLWCSQYRMDKSDKIEYRYKK